MSYSLNFIFLLSLYPYGIIHCIPTIHGRYTRDVNDYELLVPRKLTEEGNFLTFSIPHYFKHDTKKIRATRATYSNAVHYGITLNRASYHLILLPNYKLLAPNAVLEKRSAIAKVKDMEIEKLRDKKQCHFTGKIRGHANSKVALSTCDGLVGYILIDGHRYFIEPLSEHVPNKRGQHLHMVYEHNHKVDQYKRGCGTKGDWRDAWKERFREKYMDEIDENEDVEKIENKRGLSSAHRYLETLVVADKEFLQHHKNTDYELYIMTVMNMVSDFYHDASAGNQMDVVVVRIMFLEKEEEEIDLSISQDAEKTLGSFCKWQQTVNPKDIKNPNHHDIAVLLTRYDICADNMTSCGLMGLAYVAAACTGDKPCAINEDGGLILGIVVAHEMGHVMGCSHDEEKVSGCKPQAADESYHVMSPFVHLYTNLWSTCSRTFITTFFDNDLGECLNDKPEISLYEDKNMLPGSIYDAKYQCQLDFPGSSVCKVDPEKFCKMLLCRTDATTCTSNGEPPADGTKCGEHKWCYNKKCVEMGERPSAINGGWGEWGTFSQCSRTCGGGVAIAERECSNPKPQHKGRYCLGDRKKIKICNITPCPENTASYRTVQCSEFDDKPFQDKLYKWKPYMKEGDPCSLYCLNDDNIFVKLAPRAKDGTRCMSNTKNMCISGVCRKVGCDNILDSDAIEDDCGVCKGDGTECKIVERTYAAPAGSGYVKVAVIFRGCRNIIVEENKESPNTIAITGPDEKKYYLNGGYTEQQDGVRQMGGVEGLYSHTEPNKEKLVIHGPLKENIVLYVVFYQNENVGYKYRYAEPTSKSSYQPVYHWEFVDWEPCSARCGGGIEISEAKCIEEKAGLVSPSFCPATEKPPQKTQKCNEEPCRTKWRIGKWGPCYACKNTSGMSIREIECVRESSKAGVDDVLVEDKDCSEKKPGSIRLCNSQGKCVSKKREAYELPTDMMRLIWLQTAGTTLENHPSINDIVSDARNARIALRDIRRHNHKREDGLCSELGGGGNSSKESKGNSDLKSKVGTIIHDNVDPEALKVIQVPVKESHNAINLTDDAFETMGDVVPDTLDFQHEKVITGKEAAKLLKQSHHANTSVIELN